MIRGQVKPKQNSSMIPQIAPEHLLTAGLSTLSKGERRGESKEDEGREERGNEHLKEYIETQGMFEKLK